MQWHLKIVRYLQKETMNPVKTFKWNFLLKAHQIKHSQSLKMKWILKNPGKQYMMSLVMNTLKNQM